MAEVTPRYCLIFTAENAEGAEQQVLRSMF
jgi:hypothetical protein